MFSFTQNKRHGTEKLFFTLKLTKIKVCQHIVSKAAGQSSPGLACFGNIKIEQIRSMKNWQ